MVELADITLARYRLAPYLAPTPLEAAVDLGADVWLKLENANKTHSFKVRGALNALLALPEARGRAASSRRRRATTRRGSPMPPGCWGSRRGC